MNWVQKYAPRRLRDIAGHSQQIDFIKKIILEGGPICLLLHGPSGVGKSALAKIIGRRLVCEACSGNDTDACGACHSCLEFEHRPGVLDCANGGVASLRDYLPQNRGPSAIVKRKIYRFDEVQGASASGQDALLVTLETATEHEAFLLSTTEPHTLRPALRSRLKEIGLGSIDFPDALSHARAIYHREKVQYEDAAVRTLVHLSRGNMRKLLQLLETAAKGVAFVSEARARAMSGLNEWDVAATILRNVADGDGPSARAAVKRWNLQPEQKAQYMQDALAELWTSNDVAKDGYDGGSLMRSSDLDALGNAFADLAKTKGVPAERLLESATRLMQPRGGSPRDADLILNITDLIDLLHRVVSNRPALRSPSRRKAMPSLAQLNDRACLSCAQAFAVIDSASFLIQEHGRYFNSLIVLDHARLGSESSALELSSELLHQMRLALTRWNREEKNRFDFVRVEEAAAAGQKSLIALRVPEIQQDRAEHWLLEKFLAKRFEESAGTAVAIRFLAPVSRSSELRLHWALIRYLIRSLDPGAEFHDGTRTRRLVDLLKLSPCPLGQPLNGKTKRIGMSATIGPKAFAIAESASLSPLSAIGDRAFDAIYTGWERLEHEERAQWRARLEVERRRLHERWLAVGTPLAEEVLASRDAELSARLPKDPKRRKRSWRGWWGTHVPRLF